MNRIVRMTITSALAFLPAAASAELPVALKEPIAAKFVGSKSGPIPSATDPALLCARLSHEVQSPRDAATGLQTGRRTHKPITCTVRSVSSGILKLYSAWSTNEPLSSAVFTFAGKDASVITLTNAVVSGIKYITDENGVWFDITFNYQKITWQKDKTVFSDTGLSTAN